ncbi:hypothetical protein GCM10012320_08050 [Sinomonas cellulolyticus]|nr:hypothetical protein GCM10012320_08050 [Sinomonas sp. KCTC 49339]
MAAPPRQPGSPRNRTHRSPATIKLSERLSGDVIAELLKSYQAGASSRQLAVEFGINKTSVVTLLRQHDVPVRNARMTPNDIMRLCGCMLSAIQLPRSARN